MKDFYTSSQEEITLAISGKTVKSVLSYDEHGENYLEIIFTDGSNFKICYDWIYEWKVNPPADEVEGQ